MQEGVIKQGVRLGVDIGGTFTDAVLEVAGSYYSTKVLTSYHAPEDSILDAMMKVCAKASVQPENIEQIIHGTTLATNALIERRGAKTAFITTRGFRDVIEMRTESRFEQYDLNLKLPEPLIPRNRRYVIEERVAASGEILIPLDLNKVKILADELAEAKYESIAIGLLHAYANDGHEQKIAEILRQRMPSILLSLSSVVSPQMREYERFNTTIANAYIQPLMKAYLDRLKGRLKDAGSICPVFLMHSGGGIISLESAAALPVRLVESGPAGGAIFAAEVAARHQLDKVLSFDMGGTTAKICLIQEQTPKTARVFEVARSYRFKKGSGMPISIPVIDMVEIGAGGGSLAHVDNLRQIRVGPESAGSEPGPACYGRGGTRPAVTDADLIMGKLDIHNFAGGTIQLERQKSADALERHIGDVLDMDACESAWGLAEVVDENMANAARVHAIENGEDLSNYVMIAFGGAAPLHASRMCEKLGISRCLVPKGAGVGSAIGFLRAPFSFEANRSVFMPMRSFEPETIKELFADMQDEATKFVRSCDYTAQIDLEYKIYMRYSGQGWEIPVHLKAKDATNPDARHFLARFEEDYKRLFGRTVQGMEAEITVWSVNAITPTTPPSLVEAPKTLQLIENSQTRACFDPALGQAVKAQIIERDALKMGRGVEGPALIIEDETTIVLPASRSAGVASDGTIDIRTKGHHEQSQKADSSLR